MRQLIDSSGRLMGSSSGRDLKVIETGNRAFVTLKLRRDSMRQMGRMGEAALESRYLGGEKAPSRLVSTRMDVFKAVRLAKHINERYELERSRLSGCMFALKSVVSLSESGNLQGAMGLLGKVVNEMSAHSFYKILAKIKLESALNGMGNAYSAESEFQKYRHLNPAISIVYAGIRRIEARCSELDGKSDYNFEREMYLRYLRDTYMRDVLSSLYSSLILGNKYAIANAYKSDFEIYLSLIHI